LIVGAGFCTIVLMRDAILQELGNWTIWFSRFALYAAEAITVSTYVHQLPALGKADSGYWNLHFNVYMCLSKTTVTEFSLCM